MSNTHQQVFLSLLSEGGFGYIHLDSSPPQQKDIDRLQHPDLSPEGDILFCYPFHAPFEQGNTVNDWNHRDGFNLVVVWRDEEPIAVIEWSFVDSDSMCLLQAFEVLTKHQGKGYGEKILRMFCTGYVLQGKIAVHLESRPEAVTFYRKTFSRTPGLRFSKGHRLFVAFPV